MNDEYFMNLALKEAQKAYKLNEVPVGCIITDGINIIAKAYNTREKKQSVFGHAELIAIRKANKKLNSWILDNLTMYVTLEPCLMCAGAIMQSRIKRVVYASSEPKFGCFGSIMDLSKEEKFNHKIEVVKGVNQSEASLMMKAFFKELRNKKIKS